MIPAREKLERCPLPDCRAPLVLVLGDSIIVLRCGHCGKLRETLAVADPRTSWVSWFWGDDA